MTIAASRVDVFVAEDNRDMREIVCALIAAEPDMHVTGTAASVTELLDAMRTSPARVLVLDLDLHGESSVPALQTLRASQPELAVVIFSGSDRDALAPLQARVGRCEYALKTGDAAPLLAAIRRAARG